MYNALNMSNFGGFSGLAPLPDAGTPAANGNLNGPNTQAILNTARAARGSGSGTFDAGGPRTTEFQLKLTF
jgi:hypothetical protein